MFGTSGHRGSSLDGAFNEPHIIAITAAIIEYRRSQGTDGPLFIGRDTHALSEPAWPGAPGGSAARPNEVLRAGVGRVRGVGVERAPPAETTRRHDFLSAYV